MEISVSSDTICALSTPVGRSAIAIIRVSGAGSIDVFRRLTGSKTPEARTPELKILKDSAGRVLDEAITLFFYGPKSYTGEDLLEIHCHGNPKIVEEIIAEIVSRETRLAEAGEFTRRALANGRMSIDQVESLDWVLNSSSIKGVRLGISSKLGALKGSVDQIRAPMLDLLVEAQSQLDFSELEVGEFEQDRVIGLLESTISKLQAWIAAFDSNKNLLNTFRVVLIGPPNSGKSSLFNVLVGSEKAIVFDQPGTTRDSIEESIEVNGRSLVLVDTAGIRENPDPIEGLGIKRTLLNLELADLAVWVSEKSSIPEGLLEKFRTKNWLMVQSKADLPNASEISAEMRISSHTGQGIEKLRERLIEGLPGEADSIEVSALTSQRQRNLVEAAAEDLKQAKAELGLGANLDLVTHKIVQANKSLEEITGGVANEDVLREIFSRFCIGK